jgi:transcriptional regulator NrdR family protein
MCCPWCGEEDHKVIEHSPHRGMLSRRTGYYCYSCHKTFTVEERVQQQPWYKRQRRDASDNQLPLSMP